MLPPSMDLLNARNSRNNYLMGPGGLSRKDALQILAESAVVGGACTRASDAVRDAMRDRIDRTDYSKAKMSNGGEGADDRASFQGVSLLVSHPQLQRIGGRDGRRHKLIATLVFFEMELCGSESLRP